MGQESSIRRGLIDAAMMALVTGLSLLLLIYVGFGEATRTFQQFQIEKLAAQGRVAEHDGYVFAPHPADRHSRST
jgi:hypothetical protein